MGESATALLKHVLDGTLTVDQGERFADADALGAELRRLRDLVAPLTPAIKDAMDEMGGSVAGQLKEASKTERRHVWRDRVVWVLVGALLAVLAGIVLLLSNQQAHNAALDAAVGHWEGNFSVIGAITDEGSLGAGSYIPMSTNMEATITAQGTATIVLNDQTYAYELQDMGGSMEIGTGAGVQTFFLTAAGKEEGRLVIHSYSKDKPSVAEFTMQSDELRFSFWMTKVDDDE